MRRRWGQLAAVVFRQFGEDRLTTVAAGLAYYLLLAIFPMLLFLIGVASFVADRDDIKREVIEAVNEVVPIQSSGESDIGDAVDSVVDARGAVAILGLLGLMWSASSYFGALRTAINDVWEVRQSRPFPLQKAMDLGAVIGVLALLVLSVATTFILQVLRGTSESFPVGGEAAGPLWTLAAFLVPVAISFVTFTVVYYFVPNTKVELRHAMIGAVVATVLFEATKIGFAYYLRYFGNYEATYGSFGALIAFLFWAYLIGIYVLMGAQVASEYPRVQRGDYDIPEALRGPSLIDRIKAAWLSLRSRLRRQQRTGAGPPAARA
jgi:membrane protein